MNLEVLIICFAVVAIAGAKVGRMLLRASHAREMAKLRAQHTDELSRAVTDAKYEATKACRLAQLSPIHKP